MEEQKIGKVTHHFGHLSVGIIELSDTLKLGDTIHIKGHTSDFTQKVDSIQIENADVQEAKAGDVVGLKVSEKVHPHDTVFKVTE